MSKRILVFMVLFTLTVSGCSFSKSETIKSDLPALENEWAINMTHSGGIMGLSRSIEISSDGKYIVADERANKNVTKELETEELATLKDIVEASQYSTLKSQKPTGCADCFVYDLAIRGSGIKFSVQLDDISLPDSGMEPLVMYLRDLIDAALK